jgi:oxygen-dependent protoporphyrinogen oxidase
MIQQKKIAVIGCGISGMAAAYFLYKKGYSVEIFESDSKIGGRAGSIYLKDKPVDIGGKNIGREYTLFRKFINEMGKHQLEFFGINSSTVQNGKLYTIDSEKRLASISNLIQLIGFFNFFKFVKLALAVKKDSGNGFLDGPYFTKLSAKYDHQPITSYFSSRFNDFFLRPIVIRMNGSEPEDYFLGNFGSNIRMVLDKYDQFKYGMSHLFNDFKKIVPIRLNTAVKEIIRQNHKVTGIVAINSKGDEHLLFDGVFITTPAIISSQMLKGAFLNLSQHLQKIHYNPVTLAVVRYNKNIFNPSVRAIVFDKKTALSNAGCYGIYDLNIVRYTLSGNKAKQTISEETDPSEVIDLAEKTLNRYVPVSKDLRQDFVYKHFTIGLCAYSPFHYRVMADMEKELANISCLGLTGDYVRGASLEACFRAAKENVEVFHQKMEGI